MRRFRLLAFGLAFSASLIGAQSGPVVMRRDLSKPTTDSYIGTFTSTQSVTSESFPSMGEMTVTAGMKMAFKTGVADEKTKLADLELHVSDIKVDFGAMAAMMADMMTLPKEYWIKAKVNDRNRMSDVKVEGLSPEMEQMMRGMAQFQSAANLELPEHPVKVGDTWTITMPKSPATGNKDLPVQVRFVAERVVDGTPAVELEVVMDVPVDQTVKNEMHGQAMEFKIKGSSKSKSTILLERGTLRLISNESKSTYDQVMEMSDHGMTMNVKGTASFAVKLVKS